MYAVIRFAGVMMYAVIRFATQPGNYAKSRKHNEHRIGADKLTTSC